MDLFFVQKLGQLLADFVQTFRPAAKMVSIAGLLPQLNICYIHLCLCICQLMGH